VVEGPVHPFSLLKLDIDRRGVHIAQGRMANTLALQALDAETVPVLLPGHKAGDFQAAHGGQVVTQPLSLVQAVAPMSGGPLPSYHIARLLRHGSDPVQRHTVTDGGKRPRLNVMLGTLYAELSAAADIANEQSGAARVGIEALEMIGIVPDDDDIIRRNRALVDWTSRAGHFKRAAEATLESMRDNGNRHFSHLDEAAQNRLLGRVTGRVVTRIGPHPARGRQLAQSGI
jgi:hypothetical protein